MTAVVNANTAAVATKATLQSGALATDSTVAPNAAAVRTAINTAVAGVSTGTGVAPAVRISRTTVIPLDTTGEGKAMPPVAGNVSSIVSDDTYTIATGAVINGLRIDDIVTTGASSITFGAGITPLGATIDPTEVGRRYQVRF